MKFNETQWELMKSQLDGKQLARAATRGRISVAGCINNALVGPRHCANALERPEESSSNLKIDISAWYHFNIYI